MDGDHNGVIFILDLRLCCCDRSLLVDLYPVADHILTTVSSSGLVICDKALHQFKGRDAENDGHSGAIVLAESHVTWHSWPSRSSIHADVYVCHYNNDNTKKAEYVKNEFVKLFNPSSFSVNVIKR